MRISVTVTPNAKKPQVTQTGSLAYNVKVDAPAVDNKANLRLIAIIAKHFGIPRGKVLLMKGVQSRLKVLEIIGLVPRL